MPMPPPPGPAATAPAIRPYLAADRAACLTLFDANTPRYFAPYEREQFVAYLEGPGIHYRVAEAGGRIVACGGFGIEGGEGRLFWGMVDPAAHGSSIGSALLVHRVEALFGAGARAVGIDTSQLVEGFFARHGFRKTEVIADGLAPGLDLVKMTLVAADWPRGRGAR